MQDYYVKGLAHMGLLPALVQDMRDLGADTGNFDNSAENFIRMWERTYDTRRSIVNRRESLNQVLFKKWDLELQERIDNEALAYLKLRFGLSPQDRESNPVIETNSKVGP